jgi:hypothetical protein
LNKLRLAATFAVERVALGTLVSQLLYRLVWCFD